MVDVHENLIEDSSVFKGTWNDADLYGKGDVVEYPHNSTIFYKAALANTNAIPSATSVNWRIDTGHAWLSQLQVGGSVRSHALGDRVELFHVGFYTRVGNTEVTGTTNTHVYTYADIFAGTDWIEELEDGEVTEVKLAPNAVTQEKIHERSVGPNELELWSIEPRHLASVEIGGVNQVPTGDLEWGVSYNETAGRIQWVRRLSITRTAFDALTQAEKDNGTEYLIDEAT